VVLFSKATIPTFLYSFILKAFIGRKVKIQNSKFKILLFHRHFSPTNSHKHPFLSQNQTFMYPISSPPFKGGVAEESALSEVERAGVVIFAAIPVRYLFSAPFQQHSQLLMWPKHPASELR